MNGVTTDERLGRLEVQVETNTNDILDIKEENKDIHRIATSVEVLATEMRGFSSQMEEVKESVAKVDDRITTLDKKVDIVSNAEGNKLVSRWDKIKDNLGWLFIGGLVAYALNQIFVNIKF